MCDAFGSLLWPDYRMGEPEIEGWAEGNNHYWELQGDVSVTVLVILYYDSPLTAMSFTIGFKS